MSIKKIFKILNNCIIYVFVFFVIRPTWAHPVIYKDGIVFNTENNKSISDITLSYSFTSSWALGLHFIKENRKEKSYLQLAHLIQRWNETDSQANVYGVVGLGVDRTYDVDSKYVNSQIYELMADWENRDYYIQGMQRYSSDTEWHSRLRGGISPYQSESHELGIWAIVQFDKISSQNWETTQLLRFYYKNVLWEVGASLNGSYQINLMTHL